MTRALMLALGLCAIVELGVFRAGLYRCIVEPESYAGKVVAVERDARRFVRQEGGGTTVIVLGDSRVGEGFSAKHCNDDGPGDVQWFNGSLAGSTPRVWCLLLESLQRQGCRFDVIVVPLQSVAGRTMEVGMAARTLDAQFIPGLHDAGAAFRFARSFADRRARRDMTLRAALQSYALRTDVMGLLRAPRQRLRRVREGAGAFRWQYAYMGRDEDESDELRVTNGTVTFRDGVAAAVRASHEAQLRMIRADERPEDRDYLRYWLGRIETVGAGMGARVVVVRLPRGPLGALYPQERVEDARQSLGLSASTVILPLAPFEAIERPDCFFDAVHMNSRGRSEFSAAILAAFHVARAQVFAGRSGSTPSHPVVTVPDVEQVLDLTEGFTDTSVEAGMALTDDTPWGKTVVRLDIDGWGRCILGAAPRVRIRLGPFAASAWNEATLVARVGYYPPARKWNVSDGVVVRVLLADGRGETELWTKRMQPSDDPQDVRLTLDGIQGMQFSVVVESSDSVGHHGLGDWVLWGLPRLEVSRSRDTDTTVEPAGKTVREEAR